MSALKTVIAASLMAFIFCGIDVFIPKSACARDCSSVTACFEAGNTSLSMADYEGAIDAYSMALSILNDPRVNKVNNQNDIWNNQAMNQYIRNRKGIAYFKMADYIQSSANLTGLSGETAPDTAVYEALTNLMTGQYKKAYAKLKYAEKFHRKTQNEALKEIAQDTQPLKSYFQLVYKFAAGGAAFEFNVGAINMFIAEIFVAMGDKEKAREHLDIVMNTYYDDLDDYELEREALDLLYGSLLDTGNFPAVNGLMQEASAYFDKEAFNDAAVVYTMAILLEPTNEDVLYHIASCLYEMQEDRRAVDYFYRYLRFSKDDSKHDEAIGKIREMVQAIKSNYQ